jgi:DNA-binding Xre family transcriptional regulator
MYRRAVSNDEHDAWGGSDVGDDDASRGLADVLAFPSIATPPADRESGLRPLIGSVLRNERLEQERTLADVARTAAVSLAYLSEVERGRKEISSDLLDAVCDALEIPLVEVLERCVDRLRAGAQGGTSLQLCAA